MRLSAVLLGALAGRAVTADFNPGSTLHVVYGDGASSLTSASRTVVIRELHGATRALLSTTALPTAPAGAHRPCTMYLNGAEYVGGLARSSDGRFVVLACLGCAPGSTVATAGCPRVVARVHDDA